ncbi:MAG: hypothetical protein AMK73_05245 [Planctomycetes bacterium SM23_32]|nr:MAG: hypothetical protein AMK73_05245 [Planctomycetes bacterium SM23_32]
MSARIPKLLLVLALLAGPAARCSAQQRWEPRVGYVYPAGAQRGSTVEVIVGGQVLQDVTGAYVSGEGVRAVVIKHYRPDDNLDGDERRELQRRMRELRERQLAELARQGRAPSIPDWILGQWRQDPDPRPPNEPAPTGPVELPQHPLLRDLERKDLRQLQEVANTFLEWQYLQRRQPNAQLSDMVLVTVIVSADAPPGERELRLATALGLSNPVPFQVSSLPETREQEPNDPEEYTYLPETAPVYLPAVINGQILPGDVDRLRFHAKRGQHLVIDVRARRLAPFLADAVPGWFQAVAGLYDPGGRRVAYADDNAFRPDPVILYEVPTDGVYELEIRDAIYRGRQDFVYRVVLGEVPFITDIFPLGAQTGARAFANARGWNLPSGQLPLDTGPEGPAVRQAALGESRFTSNPATYHVDPLPCVREVEPNDGRQNAQRIALPVVVDGCIGRPDETDAFQFSGRAGQEVVVEVLARRLGSPLDSVVWLSDMSARVVAWNDDHMIREAILHPDMGTLTHHADSYLSLRLPQSGNYVLTLADVQGAGSEAHSYRLRIGPPRPDFALCATPSSLSMPYGRVVPLTVHALRKEGFDGEIRVALADPPAGFVLSGGIIPPGSTHVTITLTGAMEVPGQPVALRLEGRAAIGGQPVTRPVVPAEDMTQAFLWRHLVPSQELLVYVRPSQWGPISIVPEADEPVPIPVGGTATVRCKTPGWRVPIVGMQVVEPKEKLTISGFASAADLITFTVQTEGDAAQAGLAGNLIVEGFAEWEVSDEERKGNPDAPATRRSSIGILPAVPFTVVEP